MLRIWVSERKEEKNTKSCFPYSVLELLVLNIVLVRSKSEHVLERMQS
jgi:hypothetical protein